MSIVFHFINFTVKWKIRYRNRTAKQHDKRDLSVSLNITTRLMGSEQPVFNAGQAEYRIQNNAQN